MAGLVAVGASLGLWDPLDSDERTHVLRIVRHSAEGARADLQGEIQALLRSQALLARAWGHRAGLTRAEWEREAALFAEHHPSCLGATWSDPSSGVRWSFASPASRRRLDPDAVSLPSGRGADRAGGDAGLASLTVTQDRLVSFVTAEAATGEEPPATLTLVFDLPAALRAMLSDHRDLGYEFAVRHEGNVVYRSPGPSAGDEASWAESVVLRLPGGAWELTAWPGKELLAEMRSPLPELALVFGAVLGALLALSVLAARAAGARSREIEHARAEVERQVEQRTEELRRTNERLNAEVAERARAERELRLLSFRLLSFQDEERRRLARELHDSTAQVLVAAALALDRARRAGASGGEALDDVSALLGQATQEVRTQSFLLHPPVLDDLGLEYALPWYAEGFGRRSGVAVSVDVAPGVGRLAPETELALYRVVQEALANVHRHSGSAEATLRLRRDERSVTLEVADRGRGIAAGTVGEGRDPSTLGVGIAGMRERVRQLGGCFEIRTGPTGTQVRVVLPARVDRVFDRRQDDAAPVAAV